jgi:hypothetical protein
MSATEALMGFCDFAYLLPAFVITVQILSPSGIATVSR